MKKKIILGIAALLTGALAGCSTAPTPTAGTKCNLTSDGPNGYCSSDAKKMIACGTITTAEEAKWSEGECTVVQDTSAAGAHATSCTSSKARCDAEGERASQLYASYKVCCAK